MFSRTHSAWQLLSQMPTPRVESSKVKFGLEHELEATMDWYCQGKVTVASAFWKVPQGNPKGEVLVGVALCRQDEEPDFWRGMREAARQITQQLWSRVAARSLLQGCREQIAFMEKVGLQPQELLAEEWATDYEEYLFYEGKPWWIRWYLSRYAPVTVCLISTEDDGKPAWSWGWSIKKDEDSWDMEIAMRWSLHNALELTREPKERRFGKQAIGVYRAFWHSIRLNHRILREG